MKPSGHGSRYLGAFQAFFLAVVLVTGVGPIHQRIHILQVHHHADSGNRGGCGCLCHHHEGHDLETEKPDGREQTKPGRPEPDDQGGSSDHKDCPECQVLNSLKTVDPPSIPVDHLFTRERGETLFVYAEFVFEDPFHLLPSIRAPPAT